MKALLHSQRKGGFVFLVNGRRVIVFGDQKSKMPALDSSISKTSLDTTVL